jgi:hypothetical protein
VFGKLVDIEAGILESLALAPQVVLDNVGDLSHLESWPIALFYMALKRFHPLLNANGDYLLDPKTGIASNRYDKIIMLCPDLRTATSYALDALKQIAEESPARAAEQKVQKKVGKSVKKRADRAAAIEAIKKELIQYIRDARCQAHGLRGQEETPPLHERLSKKLLAKLAGVKVWTVYRCFKESEELRMLWRFAANPHELPKHGS